jgi:iron complex outermembrane receptor protein
MVHVSAVLCIVLSFILSAGTASAQDSVLSGRIVDPQGAPIAGAEVVVISGPVNRSTKSAADGSFRITGVSAGTYELLVIASGFANQVRTAVAGTAAAPLTISLDLAQVSEEVTVDGALAASIVSGKTNLPLRDLPMTVNRVDELTIREQGVNDLVSALQNVTGVNPFTQYGVYEGYTFRGFVDLFPPTAAQLVDGVRNETTNRINTQLSSIERIEVLKGPASALYGGGALGATVNLIRRKPAAQPVYDASASFGRWELARGTFGATGRLNSDALLYRLDIGADSREGFRHNTTRRLNVTPSLAWRIGANDQVNVYYTFTRDQFAGDAGIPLLPTDQDRVNLDDLYPAGVPRDRNFRTPQDEALSFDHNLQVAYARQISNSVGFRNTLSYRRLNDEYFIVEFLAIEEPSDVYREFLQFKHHRRPLTNQAELTMRFRGGIEHNLVAGWEGQRYWNHTDTIPGGGVAEAEYIDLFDPIETQQPIDPPIARIRTFNDRNNAFYAQDHLSLGEKVKAMVGGRVDLYRHHRYDVRLDGGVPAPERRRETNAFTGRLGLVYQPSPLLDVYTSYATSFFPLQDAQPNGDTLEPLTGRQLEIGKRLHLVGGRVDVNTTVFHQVRENYAFARPGGVFDQASEITSKGVEVDVTTAPVSNWRVNGGYAYTHAALGDFLVNPTTNLRGRRPVFAPRHTFNVWTAYDWTNGFGINVGARALSGQFGDRNNVYEIGGYGLLNAAVRYSRSGIEYALNVSNLTDTDYYASTLYDTQVYPGEPINVLATVRFRFR